MTRLEQIAGHAGVPLCIERSGPEHGTGIVLAHGFGQTRHAWSGTATALSAQGYRCFATDGRGHGDSGWPADGQYGFEDFLHDVHRVAAHAGPAPIWVGASMGGLLGLVAEGESPGLFSTLVLVDCTPRWEPAGVGRIMDFMGAHPDGFASLEEAQQAVQDYLPHRAASRSPERLAKLLRPMPNGRLRWHWDARLLATVAKEAEQWSGRLHDAARRLRIPTLLVSGGRSDVVSDATISEFLKLVPHAEHACIAEATHMVAGDANDRFTDTISHYLQRVAAADATIHAGVTK